MTSQRTYLIRVDGGSQVGFGHLFRCLALAEELVQNQWMPVFIVRDFDHGRAQELLREQNYVVHSLPSQADLMADARFTLDIANKYGVRGIIVDLNHSFFLRDTEEFVEFLSELKNSNFNVSVIDGGTPADCLAAKAKFAVDAVFIPYCDATQRKYQVNGSTKLFLGPQYFIFRQQFQEWIAKPKVIHKTVSNLLISLGGSAPRGLIELVSGILKEISVPLNIQIVLGLDSHPEIREGILTVLADGIHRVTIIDHALNMAELLYHADIAIVGSGLTKYEAAVVGTPMICLAEEEMNRFFDNNDELRQIGVFLQLGSGLKVVEIRDALLRLIEDFSLRQEYSKNGKHLLDGKGTQRTVELLQKGCLNEN